MRSDVLHAASCGAHGVVLGMLCSDGRIDQDTLRPFVELCSALGGCWQWSVGGGRAGPAAGMQSLQ